MSYLQIFERGYVNRSPVKGISQPREIHYLRRILTYNRDLIRNYYSSRNFAVRNTHIISRIVQHIPPMLGADLYDFIYRMKGELHYLGKNFQITSAGEQGIVHPAYFYGNDGSELLFAEDTNTDYEWVRKNWKIAKCIDVWEHQRNDTRLLLPYVENDGSRGGLSTVKIDLMTLAIMYREFVREQSISLENSGAVYSKNVFVAKYILPNFLENDIDFRVLNRVIDRFYGNEIVTPKFKHQVALNDTSRRLDKFADDVLDTITKGKMTFMDIMFNVPLIFKVNMADLLAYDDIPNTRQANWLFLVSRLKYICFLYDVSSHKEMSTGFIADWKINVKRMEQDNRIYKNLPPRLHAEVSRQIQKIKDM